MNATILLPSREKPDQFRQSVKSLFDTASDPANVEVIARVDHDDPKLSEYLAQAGAVTRLIVGPRLKGYPSNHVFYEDCAKLSRGNVLVLWNDDMQMETRNWDERFIDCFVRDPFVPASAVISSPGEGRGGHFRWACAAISRRMYVEMGAFAIGADPSIDRCYEALAKHLGRETRSGVCINHDYNHSFEGTRGEHYAACHREWGQRAANWEAIGERYAFVLKGCMP